MSAALSLPDPRAIALQRVLMHIAAARVAFTFRRLERAVARLETSRARAHYALERAHAAVEHAAGVSREQPSGVWRCRCRLGADLSIKACGVHS